MDMLYGIFRRVLKREPIGAPDRLHFHKLIMRGLGLSYFHRTQQNVTNPLATTLVLQMTAVPIIAAQFLWYVIGQSAVSPLFFGALFIVTYRSLLFVILQGASTRHQRTAAKTNALVSDPSVTPAE
jgi:UDP-GlcNAc:undecaprenyl-phosphate GlcNAc-1-phosphate transferase